MPKYCYWISTLLLALCLTACLEKGKNIHQGYLEGKFTYVASQTSGTLDQIYVTRGTWVKQGDRLFQLDRSPQNTDLQRAEAQLAEAHSKLADAEKGSRPTEIASMVAQKQALSAKLVYVEKTVIRYHKLLQQHFIEQSTYDQIISNRNDLRAQIRAQAEKIATAKLGARSDTVAAAKANVKAFEAALEKTKWALHQKDIVAPIAGQVFDTFYRTGETVAPNQPVVSMLSPTNIRVIFFIPEQQLSALQIDSTVSVNADGYKAPFTAKISFISPKPEYTPPTIYSEKTRANLIYRIEATPENPDIAIMHPGQPVIVKTASADEKH